MVVSVIVPCYNCEVFVHNAINSVLKQSYTNWELILVDNNSTDATLQILKEYQVKHPDKIYVLEEATPGAPAARNKGLQIAKGEWIQFLDADDEILPNKLEHQLELLVKNTGKDNAIIAAAVIFRYISNGKTTDRVRVVSPGGDAWAGLLKSQLGITSGNLFNKNAVLQAGAWDEGKTSSQEYHLLFKLLKAGYNTIFDNETLTIINKHTSTISADTNPEKRKKISDNRIQLRIAIKEYLVEKGMFTPDHEAAFKEYVHGELLSCIDNNMEYVDLMSEQLGITVVKPKQSLKSKIRNAVKALRGNK